MTRSSRRKVLAFVAAAASVPSIASAAPPDTHTCIAAFDDGQRLRSDGKLRAAREKLLVCSQRECPGVLREDCAGVLREVELAIPTIVLSASDREGHDLADVAVTLAGQPLATRLEGRAVSVDPGRLALTFERKPWAPVTVEIVVAEGEKNRNVRATLGPPPGSDPYKPADEAPASERSLAGWAVPIGLGVVGAGALAFAGATRIRIGNEADDLRAACAPECPPADRDRLASDLATANVALGVGLASLAIAAVTWFVLAPRGSAPSPKTVSLAW